MRAAKFARDAHPERTPREVMDEVSMTTPATRLGDWSGGLAATVDAGRPRSWEELDCPDEIELELHRIAGEWSHENLCALLRANGMSGDQVLYPVHIFSGPDHLAVITKQAEDCWYAGVPRGRRLVLRRI